MRYIFKIAVDLPTMTEVKLSGVRQSKISGVRQ